MAAKNAILLEFGRILREVRLSKSMTVQHLEAATGINHGNISRIENGQKSLELITIVKLCKGLKISADQLLTPSLIDLID